MTFSTKIHAHLEIPKPARKRLNDLTAEVHIHYQDGTSLLFRAAHTGSRDNMTVHTAHTTAIQVAPECLTARCFLMGKCFSMRHQLILRKLLQNFSKLKAAKFYNQKRITSIYKTCKRQKLVCVGVCVCFVCMYVCEDVYVTFKTSYKHKTRPRNNWCAPHRSAARGAFICLYST